MRAVRKAAKEYLSTIVTTLAAATFAVSTLTASLSVPVAAHVSVRETPPGIHLVSLASTRTAQRPDASPAVRSAVAPASHQVVEGDTLAGIGVTYFQIGDWRGLCAFNKIANCNLIVPGEVIQRGIAAPPPPAPAPVVTVTAEVHHAYQAPTHHVYHAYQAPAAHVNPGSYGGGFQACVISRESGGNPNVMNGSGHYGLYQFDFGTWVSGGGSPGTFGHASVAEQNAVFARVYAARGTNPWAPYDGC